MTRIDPPEIADRIKVIATRHYPFIRVRQQEIVFIQPARLSHGIERDIIVFIADMHRAAAMNGIAAPANFPAENLCQKTSCFF